MTTRTTNNTLGEIADFLKTLDRVAVTTHVGADGDAIGASAALVRLMHKLGAEAVFCHAEAVPGLPGLAPARRAPHRASARPRPARRRHLPRGPHGRARPRSRARASTSTTTRTTRSTPSTTSSTRGPRRRRRSSPDLYAELGVPIDSPRPRRSTSASRPTRAASTSATSPRGPTSSSPTCSGPASSPPRSTRRSTAGAASSSSGSSASPSPTPCSTGKP